MPSKRTSEKNHEGGVREGGVREGEVREGEVIELIAEDITKLRQLRFLKKAGMHKTACKITKEQICTYIFDSTRDTRFHV